MKNPLLNRSNFVVPIAALLIFLYIYTATNKLLDLHKFKTVLSKSPLINRDAAWLSITIPAIEIFVSLFLLFPHYRKLGFLSSSVLMSAFTLYIGYMILFVPHLPCSCGGIISKLTWPQHLIADFLFLTVSILGFFLQKKEQKFLLQ